MRRPFPVVFSSVSAFVQSKGASSGSSIHVSFQVLSPRGNSPRPTSRVYYELRTGTFNSAVGCVKRERNPSHRGESRTAGRPGQLVSLPGTEGPTRRQDFANSNQKKDAKEKSQAYRQFRVHKRKSFHHFDPSPSRLPACIALREINIAGFILCSQACTTGHR
jgi:hypothetical protein